MEIKTKFVVLFMILFGYLPEVFAVDFSMKMLEINVIMEVLIVAVVLFFCVKGIKSCIKGEGYKNFKANYYTEKMDSLELIPFEMDSAKRVKELIKNRKKTVLSKGTTINQINKKSDKEILKVK